MAAMFVCSLGFVGSSCAVAQSQSVDRASAAAVQVVASGCTRIDKLGGGSFIAVNRVVTVAHVVAGADRVTVVLPDGSSTPATVVAIDRLKDLALLAVAASTVVPLERATTRPEASGTITVTRPDGRASLPFTVRSYVDIDAPDIDADGTALRRGYQIDADVEHGDSGSVLVVEGVAVGVVFARSSAADRRAWATDITEIEPLLAIDTGSAVDVGECVGLA